MKKLFAVVSLALTALLLLSATAAAAEPDPAPADGVYAVLTLEGGDIVVDEAPDADSMDEVESYELFIESEPVLSVEQRPIGEGVSVDIPVYYSVDFTIPDTTREVFLAGLTTSNVEEIQQYIIDTYADGSDFNITDVGFIDAEKTLTEDEDDDMCWAASSADMLVYTGWAAKAGFSNEDGIFEDFIDSFENKGGNQFNAIAWFFNSAALGDNDGSSGARITDYPNSGGYLGDYAFDMYTDFFYAEKGVEDMNYVMSRLREGYAVGMGTGLYVNGKSDGGHAVTMWGAVVDSALSEDDPARYLSIFLTDSDSYESRSDDRYEASNVLNVYSLNYASSGYYYFRFNRTTVGTVDDFVCLAPYSEELAGESDPNATRDKISYPDLNLNDVCLSSVSGAHERVTLFESGTPIYFFAEVGNNSDADYAGRIYLYFDISDSDGAQVYYGGFPYAATTLYPNYFITSGSKNTPGLDEGDYTITYSINLNRSTPTEAYYYNNVRQLSFKVRDSYMSGDFDGNGSVDIMDATAIQRALAGFGVTAAQRADERGDINSNGLDIMDATQVQRHIAGFTTPFPVEEKQLYN